MKNPKTSEEILAAAAKWGVNVYLLARFEWRTTLLKHILVPYVLMTGLPSCSLERASCLRAMGLPKESQRKPRMRKYETSRFPEDFIDILKALKELDPNQ